MRDLRETFMFWLPQRFNDVFGLQHTIKRAERD
jgi:hypothetical protein